MASLGKTYVTEDLPVGTRGEPLPAGTYTAKITEADIKPTSSGGEMIKMRFDILGPTHQGRVVFGNINHRNPSAKAEEIGNQQLGDLLRAIGLGSVSDTDELVGHDLKIRLAIKPAEGQYEAQNEVKGYKSLTESTPKTATFAGSPPPPSANKTAPWKK